jgi:hypothetical protein
MVNELHVLLEKSSPPTSDSPEIRSTLSELADSIDRADRRARRRRNTGLTIGAVTAALVLGGSTAAFASPAVQDWLGFHPSVIFPWTATIDNQPRKCLLGIEVVTAANPQAVAAAREYVSELDFSTIQSGAAYQSAYAAQKQWAGASTRSKQFLALSEVVNRMISAKLASEHLNSAGIILGQGTNCTDGTK